MDTKKKMQIAMKAREKIVGGGVGSAPGIVSVGGHVGPLGGTVGLDHGKPFGSANVNGKSLGSFGPQGNDKKPVPSSKLPNMGGSSFDSMTKRQLQKRKTIA